MKIRLEYALLTFIILGMPCSRVLAQSNYNGYKSTYDDDSYRSNFSRISSKWGKMCNSQDSYYVEYRNTSGENMDLQIAIQNLDGTWTIGLNVGIGRGETISNYACHSTGKVVLHARPSKLRDKIKFPSSREINESN